jgi:hypothetical protein
MLTALIMNLSALEIHSQEADTNQFGTEQPSERRNLELLASTNVNERVGAVINLEKSRRALVRQVMDILATTNSNVLKVDAIIVAGEYRIYEAVPLMAENLGLDRLGEGRVRHPLNEVAVQENQQPVFTSLSKIGPPAVPALMERVKEDADSAEIGQIVNICQGAEGPDITQFRLQNLLAKETDEVKKERLKTAIGYLKLMQDLRKTVPTVN